MIIKYSDKAETSELQIISISLKRKAQKRSVAKITSYYIR